MIGEHKTGKQKRSGSDALMKAADQFGNPFQYFKDRRFLVEIAQIDCNQQLGFKLTGGAHRNAQKLRKFFRTVSGRAFRNVAGHGHGRAPLLGSQSVDLLFRKFLAYSIR